MSDEPPIPPLIRVLDAHLDASLDRFDKSAEPVWESQFQMGRTLITLASSALVLSITVIQAFAGKVQSPRDGWALVASWLLLGVTAVAGVMRQSWAGAERSLRMGIESKRGEIRSRVGELSVADEQLSEKFDAILKEAMPAASKVPQKAIKVHDALNQVMFWAFTLGLSGLLYFAIRNLPF